MKIDPRLVPGVALEELRAFRALPPNASARLVAIAIGRTILRPLVLAVDPKERAGLLAVPPHAAMRDLHAAMRDLGRATQQVGDGETLAVELEAHAVTWSDLGLETEPEAP